MEDRVAPRRRPGLRAPLGWLGLGHRSQLKSP
jgi:hypothetical protein